MRRTIATVTTMALAWGISTQAAAQAPTPDPKADALSWQKRGQAKNDYNMAWNHYVRTATSGLNAKSMLTGQ